MRLSKRRSVSREIALLGLDTPRPLPLRPAETCRWRGVSLRLIATTLIIGCSSLFDASLYAQTDPAETIARKVEVSGRTLTPKESTLSELRLNGPDATSRRGTEQAAESREAEATFAEILDIARRGVEQIDGEIRDYRCVLVKRERVDGKLGDYQYMLAKVRHQSSRAPFSLYLRFLKPEEVLDREVLYVKGANDGKIVAKKGGYRFSYLTTEVDPHSEIAMQGNRYPITEFGVQNLAHKLLEIAEDDNLQREFDVELRREAKVDQRPCLSIVVTKRERTESDQFYKARVFIDKELMVPIHFESYDWPLDKDKPPRLLEQYTYRNLKLNVGLTASDFDRNNPDYGFRKSR